MRKDKFLVVTSYAYPSSKATANRVHFLVDCLVQEGIYELSVISSGIDSTCSKFYNQNFIQKNNINVLYIGKLKSGNILIRAILEIIHMLKIYVKVLSVRPKFLIFTIPSPMLLLLSLVVKKNSFGIDIRDASWEYLRKKNLFFVPFCIFFENLLRISCLKAKFVTVTNSFEKESVKRVSGVSSTVLSNGILKKLYQQLSSKCFVKKRNEKISIVYYGNIGIAQHLDSLIKAIGNQENFTVTLIGNGSELKNLQKLIIDNRIRNVTIKQPVQQEDLSKEVYNADILYAQIGNAYFTAVPTKIFEYLTYGKHIVLGLPDGPAKSIFSSFNGVHIHSPECTIDTFKVLKSVNLSKPVDRELNLHKLKDSYIREDQKQKFLNLI